jgi:hypothetical protein
MGLHPAKEMPKRGSKRRREKEGPPSDWDDDVTGPYPKKPVTDTKPNFDCDGDPTQWDHTAAGNTNLLEDKGLSLEELREVQELETKGLGYL